MLNSKFDLHKTEWLDLVFENRNKAYGAYDLRKHNAETTTKALAITTFVAVAFFITSSVLMRHAPEIISHDKITVVDLKKVVVVPEVEKKVLHPIREQLHFKSQPSTSSASVTTVTPTKTFSTDISTVEPVHNIEPTSIGSPTTLPTTLPGKGIDDGTKGTPNGTDAGKGNPGVENSTPVDAAILEVMPEPLGGAEGWSRFLQKNLRYPTMAKEEGIMGKVWVSFVVERDGKISNIVVERGAGHGFDEEAVRVLKLAPAWSPGIQNGQKVRVKYTLPFNFHLDL